MADGQTVARLINQAWASMRPRVFPAEDAERGLGLFVHDAEASMRPRVFPAEDSGGGSPTRRPPRCFNEAAGIPRGRHRAGTSQGDPAERASMRPRVFPAEDRDGGSTHCLCVRELQ